MPAISKLPVSEAITAALVGEEHPVVWKGTGSPPPSGSVIRGRDGLRITVSDSLDQSAACSGVRVLSFLGKRRIVCQCDDFLRGSLMREFRD